MILKLFSTLIVTVMSVFFFSQPNTAFAEQGAVLTQDEAIQKAKAFYDSKGEWAGKFTITNVHRVRFEQSGPQSVTAHIQYQAAFIQDLTKTVEDQRTFGFQYQQNTWNVSWMGPHKSARF